MDLPALLPSELIYTQVAPNDQVLKKMLEKIPYDFVHFFSSAADDETWSESHQAFMQSALDWFQTAAFHDKLLFEFIAEIVKAIQRHTALLTPLLKQNITFVVQGNAFPASSLLWQGTSSYLHAVIRRECRDLGKNKIELQNISIEAFRDVQEYILTGEAKSLWRKEPKEIFAVLQLSVDWEITALQQSAELLLERYIDRTNAIDWLKLSLKNHWPFLLKACCQFLNEEKRGASLESNEGLSFEFHTFSDPSLDLFEDLKNDITHLVFSDRLWEEPEFAKVIKQAPGLHAVSLTGSLRFSDQYTCLPDLLNNLDLSKCGWLSSETLGKIIGQCPKLAQINLASNRQLDYLAWGKLKNLQGLQELDISHCHQVRESDFKVIVRSCNHLKKLIMNDLKSLGDPVFSWLSRQLPMLVHLDLSRTAISNETLIEIAQHHPNLESITLERCRFISDRGVSEAKKLLSKSATIHWTA